MSREMETSSNLFAGNANLVLNFHLYYQICQLSLVPDSSHKSDVMEAGRAVTKY